MKAFLGIPRVSESKSGKGCIRGPMSASIWHPGVRKASNSQICYTSEDASLVVTESQLKKVLQLKAQGSRIGVFFPT